MQDGSRSSLCERYDLGILDAMIHNSKDYKGDLEKLREMKRIIDGIASEPDNDRFHQDFSNQNSSQMFGVGFE